MQIFTSLDNILRGWQEWRPHIHPRDKQHGGPRGLDEARGVLQLRLSQADDCRAAAPARRA